MVAMLQWLDARSFFFRSQLSACSFLALFFKVFRNCLSGHGLQCGRSISVQAVQFWPLFDNYITKTGIGLITVQNVYSPACDSYPECPVTFVRNELFLDVGVCILRLGDSLGICRELGVAIFTKAKHRNICSLVGRS
jgi:hypothetical protein